MGSTAPDFAAFRFSTCGLPECDRLGHSRHIIGHTILRFDAEPAPVPPFESKSARRVLSNLIIVWRVTEPRTPERIVDGNDDTLTPLTMAGSSVAPQLGREVSDGEATVISCSDLVWVVFPTLSQHVSIGLPCKSLVPLVPRLKDVLTCPIPRHDESLQLLKSYVNMLGEAPVPATPELRCLVVAYVQDLEALMIAATQNAAAIGKDRGTRTARLQAIKADIATHIGRREFTIGTVAARQGVSTRYVQMLFETEGTTFSRYVLGQRLVRAHRMLTNPRYAGWTICAIALEVGFGDLSHFNHAFRRFYDTSPSDVRAATGRATPHEAVHESKSDFVKGWSQYARELSETRVTHRHDHKQAPLNQSKYPPPLIRGDEKNRVTAKLQLARSPLVQDQATSEP